MKTVIKSVNDLKVYQMAYQLAMEIYEITKKFPKRGNIFINRSDEALIEISCYKYTRGIC